MQKPNQSVLTLWKAFVNEHPAYAKTPVPDYFFFCDNEQDANTCAELVIKKIKQATAPSVWWYEYHNAPMPNVGDLFIVTNWDGVAKAVIELTNIQQVTFNKVDAAFAHAEGEGDKSLAYWRKAHKAYYRREMEAAGASFNKNMLISCERFKTIFVD